MLNIVNVYRNLNIKKIMMTISKMSKNLVLYILVLLSFSVYSQDKDALEYIKYINFLQSKNQLGKIEFLELEDLQGVSGLKALRVEVIYQKDFDAKSTIPFNDLIKEIKA